MASITSAILYGRRKPKFRRGQDGRVVKAGALGGAHVKSWDRTWSSPDFQQAHRGGLVLKLRPLVNVAGVSFLSRGQDGRVVKTPSLIAENGLNIRRICVGSKFCSLKEVHRLGGWC